MLSPNSTRKTTRTFIHELVFTLINNLLCLDIKYVQPDAFKGLWRSLWTALLFNVRFSGTCSLPDHLYYEWELHRSWDAILKEKTPMCDSESKQFHLLIKTKTLPAMFKVTPADTRPTMPLTIPQFPTVSSLTHKEFLHSLWLFSSTASALFQITPTNSK